MARTCSYTPALLVAILSLGGVSQGARAQPVDWRGMTSAASARGRAPSRTVGELLGRERDALRSILAEREDARRVRMGSRVARGELLRLETVHNELTRRSQGVAKEVAEREAQLRRRMRALYRLVRGTSRRPLMDPGRSQAAVDGRWLLLRILRRDLGEIGRLKREESKLSEGLEEVVRRRREARAVLSDLERRKDELQARLAQSRQELTELRHLRRNHRGQASEWDAKAFQIEREIVALHLQVNRGPSSFEGQRGTIARPVPGMILTWFGQQRIQGTKASEESRGVEISALPTWKARAPADGTVRFAGPVPGFGNVLVFDHEDGYLSLVGHLGPLMVKVGDRVKSAQPVATLSGCASGGPCKVYLELRRAGRAFDPIPWIQGGLAERSKRSPGANRSPKGTDAVVELD